MTQERIFRRKRHLLEEYRNAFPPHLIIKSFDDFSDAERYTIKRTHVKSICRINTKYLKKVFTVIENGDLDSDFLVAQVGQSYHGILFVVKRTFARKQYWYIDLVCIREMPDPSVSSRILICAFLHCLHTHSTEEKVPIILEVMNGYENLSAFIGYSKIGFVYDPKLLPTLSDFNKLKPKIGLATDPLLLPKGQANANDNANPNAKPNREVFFPIYDKERVHLPMSLELEGPEDEFLQRGLREKEVFHLNNDKSGILHMISVNDRNLHRMKLLADYSNLIYQIEFMDISKLINLSKHSVINRVIQTCLDLQINKIELIRTLTLARAAVKKQTTPGSVTAAQLTRSTRRVQSPSPASTVGDENESLPDTTRKLSRDKDKGKKNDENESLPNTTRKLSRDKDKISRLRELIRQYVETHDSNMTFNLITVMRWEGVLKLHCSENDIGKAIDALKNEGFLIRKGRSWTKTS